MDQIDRHIRQGNRRGGGGGSDAALTTLAKESFDILTLLPTYIESTKSAVGELSQDTKVNKTLITCRSKPKRSSSTIEDCKDGFYLRLYGPKSSSPYTAIFTMLDPEGRSFVLIQIL